MKPEDRRRPYYHIVRRILMVIGFLGLALYVLLIVWSIYQLVMVGVGWYDVTYRQSKSAVPPKVEDLKTLSLVPAWQYEADTRLYRIVGVAEDKLVMFTHSNRFVGIDMASGEKSWEYQSPGDITNLVTRDEIALKDGLLAFSSFVNNNNYRRLVILDAATGQELWHHQNQERGFVASTFIVGDEYVYWAIRPHYLAFDRYTGELAWQSELETGVSGYGGLLYNGEELVIVRPDMYVLDADTGETKRELQVKINSTPSRVHDQVIYVEDTVDGLVKALDIQQDTTLWEQRLNVHSDPRWTPLLREDRLYVKLNGSLAVLDADTGEVIWGRDTFEKDQAVLYSNPAFVGESACAIFSDGSLRLLRIADGAEMGSADFRVVTRDAALYATGEMLFVSTGGPTLYAYTAMVHDITRGTDSAMISVWEPGVHLPHCGRLAGPLPGGCAVTPAPSFGVLNRITIGADAPSAFFVRIRTSCLLPGGGIDGYTSRVRVHLTCMVIAKNWLG
jgi:outer membrane protein assembly factor BamB